LHTIRFSLLAAVAWLTSAANLSLAAEPATAVLVGQSPFQSERFTAADGQIRFETDGQAKTVDMQELVVWGTLPQARPHKQILLADGGVLLAEIVKSDSDRLTVDSYLFGEVGFPLENLAGILLSPPADLKRRDELEFRIRDANGEDDRLILDNGDELTGTIATLSDMETELESSAGKIKVELARVAAIVFNPSLRAVPPQRSVRAIVGVSDGSWLMAESIVTRDKQIELNATSGAKLKVNADRVKYLQPLGGRVTYLSDLKPSGYRHVPFLQLPWQWKADRNVLGTRLRAGGELCLKGIGMHSASRLSFPLDGRYRRFEAKLAIDDQTAGAGSVVFRVFLDTEQAYASPVIHGGDAPTEVAIDLPKSARTLSLIVDFAERGDEQDHANWLNARLVE
jgi:hypothetical protein